MLFRSVSSLKKSFSHLIDIINFQLCMLYMRYILINHSKVKSTFAIYNCGGKWYFCYVALVRNNSRRSMHTRIWSLSFVNITIDILLSTSSEQISKFSRGPNLKKHNIINESTVLRIFFRCITLKNDQPI